MLMKEDTEGGNERIVWLVGCVNGRVSGWSKDGGYSIINEPLPSSHMHQFPKGGNANDGGGEDNESEA